MRNIKPVKGFLLVRKLPAQEKQGSLYVPETQKKPQKEGVIVSIGPDSLYNVGTKIVYASIVLPVLIKGEDLHIVLEKEVVGIITEEE